MTSLGLAPSLDCQRDLGQAARGLGVVPLGAGEVVAEELCRNDADQRAQPLGHFCGQGERGPCQGEGGGVVRNDHEFRTVLFDQADEQPVGSGALPPAKPAKPAAPADKGLASRPELTNAGTAIVRGDVAAVKAATDAGAAAGGHDVRHAWKD